MNRPKIPARLLQNPDGIWVIRYWCERKHRYVDASTGTRSKTEANLILDKGDLQNVAILGQVARIKRQMIENLTGDRAVNFGQAKREYIERLVSLGRSEGTAKRYEVVLRNWNIDESRPIELLSENDCDEYINRQDGSHRKTRELRLSIMQSFLKFCLAHGWISRNTSLLVEVRKDLLEQRQLKSEDRVPFTDAEIATILGNSKGFWNIAVRISDATGMRLGDLCVLRWTSLGDDGRIEFLQWKTKGILRTEPIPELVAELRREFANDTEYCFPKYGRLYQCEAARSSIVGEFRAICRKSGITGKSFHCLRHGYCRRSMVGEKRKLLEQLIEELALDRTALLMGHASSETTKGYAALHPNVRDVARPASGEQSP